MSSGSGAASAGGGGSPRLAARRRVVEEELSFLSSSDETAAAATVSLHHHHHHHHFSPLHHHHHHLVRPAGRYYPALRRRVFSLVPDAWLAGIEDAVSRKNLGRRVLAALMLMAVMSLFLKVSLVGRHVEVVANDGEREDARNGLLILQTFKDDSALLAQRADSEPQTSMPKRVLESSVSQFTKKKNYILIIF